MQIRLWSLWKVERSLVEGRVTEAVSATYLAAGWLAYLAAAYSTLTFSNASRSWLGLAEFAGAVCAAAWGFLYAYQSNGGERGQDFVVRFTCLLLPASIRTQVFVWGTYHLLAMLIGAHLASLTFSSKEAADAFVRAAPYIPVVATYLAVIASQLVLFLVVGRSLKRIREAGQPVRLG
jgi:hypothetical protein